MTPKAEYYAVTTPGLEKIVAAELRALGVPDMREEVGGVAWEGDTANLYNANLRLRTATRILVRLARFRARTFAELERHARRIPWVRILAPDRRVVLRVSCQKSRLYHEGAVAERVLEAIERAAGSRGELAAAEDAADASAKSGAQLLVIRALRDDFTVSADASGDALYQRGYRQAVSRAPLRETLAAGMLLASRWTGDTPLLDPLCGSGTIPIEAALMTRRIASGLAVADRRPRDFAFLHWPDFDERVWRDIVDRAQSEILPSAAVPLRGTDHHGGALRAARANAERAGVLQDIAFEHRALERMEPDSLTSWLVTNPPYGRRTRGAESADVRTRIRSLADTLPAWGFAVLQPAAWPLHDGWTEAFRTTNGGQPVRLCLRSPRA